MQTIEKDMLINKLRKDSKSAIFTMSLLLIVCLVFAIVSFDISHVLSAGLLIFAVLFIVCLVKLIMVYKEVSKSKLYICSDKLEHKERIAHSRGKGDYDHEFVLIFRSGYKVNVSSQEYQNVEIGDTYYIITTESTKDVALLLANHKEYQLDGQLELICHYL